MNEKVYAVIQRWAGDLDGVFTLPDLRVALGDRTEAALYKRLNALVDAGMLFKVKRGIYATPEATLAAISNRIEPAAYISTGTVLAHCAVIGSIPVRRIQAIKMGRSRTYFSKQGIIEHLGISPSLYFGFEPVKGILCATPEKAFLDVCYYTYCGRRFSFDPERDVNVTDLNREIVFGYLRKYDKRFVNYFNRVWSDKW
jgi:hypothetical protein